MGPSQKPYPVPPLFAARTADTALTTSSSRPRLRNSDMTLLATVVTSLRLEPEVLKRLGRAAVQNRSATLVAPFAGQIALRDPRGSAMRRRRELRQRDLRLAERALGIVEPILFEQRAPEHQSRIADLVEHVLALAHDLERVERLLLRLLRIAGAEMHLRERRDRRGGVVVAADLERDGERLLQMV